MSRTRIVRLRDEDKRSSSSNPRTRFLEAESGTAPPSCEVAFVGAYPRIREVCSAITEPGLAIFAVDDQGLAAHAVVKPHAAAIQTAIIGRHTSADLFLADDQRLSLRHLALVMHPLRGPNLTYHLVDLRTPLGMADELGRPVEHVAAQGPLMLQVGSYAVIAIPVRAAAPWPEDPLEAWQGLPARTYVEGERSIPRRAVQEADATGIQVIRGARFAREGMADTDDVRIGQLLVRSQRGTSSFVLGDKALRGGVLLGRYDRCDNAGLPVLSDHRISRVHTLLMLIDGAVHAIDTASTNGIWFRGAEIRHHPLSYGDELEIGSRLAWIRWDATS